MTSKKIYGDYAFGSYLWFKEVEEKAQEEAWAEPVEDRTKMEESRRAKRAGSAKDAKPTSQ